MNGEIAVEALRRYLSGLAGAPSEARLLADALSNDKPVVEHRLYRWHLRKGNAKSGTATD